MPPPPLNLVKEGGSQSSEDRVGEPSKKPAGEPREAIPVGQLGKASGSRNEMKSADIYVLDANVKHKSFRSLM